MVSAHEDWTLPLGQAPGGAHTGAQIMSYIPMRRFLSIAIVVLAALAGTGLAAASILQHPLDVETAALITG